MNQLSLSLTEGRRRKRAGMALAASNNSQWMRDRLEDLREYARATGSFPIEFFRAYCALNGKPPPSSPNAWGSFATFARNQGVIRWTEKYVNASSVKTHAHPVKLYEAA